MAMKRHEGLLVDCVTVRFFYIVVRQILQQSRLLIALMVRNPIKHTISGAMTGLWQA